MQALHKTSFRVSTNLNACCTYPNCIPTVELLLAAFLYDFPIDFYWLSAKAGDEDLRGHQAFSLPQAVSKFSRPEVGGRTLPVSSTNTDKCLLDTSFLFSLTSTPEPLPRKTDITQISKAYA